MVIGTALGLLIGFAWSGREPASSRNFGDATFMQAVRSLSNTPADRPAPIADIVVHPPVDEGAKGLAVQVVTFSVPNPRGGEPARIDARLNAEIPFRASEDNTIFETLVVTRRRSRTFNFERSSEPAPPPTDTFSESQLNDLIARVRAGDAAAMTGVRVFDPIEVDGKRLVPLAFNADGTSHVLHTAVPFRRDTVLDYLRAEQERNPQLRFRYAWERDPASAMVAGASTGFVMVGLVWPTLMRLLSRRGFGPPVPVPSPREPKRRQSRSRPEPASTAVAPREPTAEQRDRLEQYTHDLEAHVVSGDQPSTQPAKTIGPLHQPIRELRAEPVEAIQPPESDDQPKEYKGEWYPVARPATHKPDAHADGTKH
jgi:hypothetical protein